MSQLVWRDGPGASRARGVANRYECRRDGNAWELFINDAGPFCRTTLDHCKDHAQRREDGFGEAMSPRPRVRITRFKPYPPGRSGQAEWHYTIHLTDVGHPYDSSATSLPEALRIAGQYGTPEMAWESEVRSGLTARYAAEQAVTAQLVRKLEGWQGDARLFKLSRPVSYGYSDYVVVQAHVAKLMGVPGPETYIYPADADGNVLDWEELPGSLRGSLDHEEALRNAGWEVVDVFPIRKAVTEARRPGDYYVIDVGTDAIDSATKRDAVQLARAAVKGGRDWNGPTVNIAIVYLSGEGREYVYALWRNPDGSFDESRDPPEVESKWQEMLAPYRGRPSTHVEESRPSRGTLWTIDYRAVWPNGGGLWRVAVVRAMSAPEALAKLRRREQGVELTKVTIEPGHNVPGYEQSHIIEGR